MISFHIQQDSPGVVNDKYVTAQAASALTGYNIQHLRRLCYAGKLKAMHVGRSWLIRVDSLEWYMNVIVSNGDGRFGPRDKNQANGESFD